MMIADMSGALITQPVHRFKLRACKIRVAERQASSLKELVDLLSTSLLHKADPTIRERLQKLKILADSQEIGETALQPRWPEILFHHVRPPDLDFEMTNGTEEAEA